MKRRVVRYIERNNSNRLTKRTPTLYWLAVHALPKRRVSDFAQESCALSPLFAQRAFSQPGARHEAGASFREVRMG
jgi:hypothetical protein